MLASAAKLVASQVEVSHSAGALQKRPELFNTYLGLVAPCLLPPLFFVCWLPLGFIGFNLSRPRFDIFGNYLLPNLIALVICIVFIIFSVVWFKQNVFPSDPPLMPGKPDESSDKQTVTKTTDR